jgi:1-acyl-sn-glycerol-3-phosphate acyltransferase
MLLSSESSNILALCLLAALGLALLLFMGMMLRKSPFTPLQSALYALNYVLVRVLWRAQIPSGLPIPPDQGAVIVCNHRCPVDPSFLVLTVPRVIHWMVAREYFEFPAFRGLLSKCGAIPIHRGGADMAAMKEAIRIVKQGGLVGLFPEGRINDTKQFLLPGHSGAAMIALKAQAPVIPCYIDGAPYDGTTLGCLLMPASVRLTIGQPIDLSEYYDRAGDRQVQKNWTFEFLLAIAQLAGRPDFQPRVAGRSDKISN